MIAPTGRKVPAIPAQGRERDSPGGGLGGGLSVVYRQHDERTSMGASGKWGINFRIRLRRKGDHANRRQMLLP